MYFEFVSCYKLYEPRFPRLCFFLVGEWPGMMPQQEIVIEYRKVDLCVRDGYDTLKCWLETLSSCMDCRIIRTRLKHL